MVKANQNNKSDILGIISIVLAFTALQIPGLIIGIVGEKSAKQEERPHTLSRIGWILNLVILVVAVLSIGIFFALIPSHRNQVDDETTKANFRVISEELEVFHDKKGYYPSTLENPGLGDLSLYFNPTKPYVYKVLPEGCTECAKFTLEANLNNPESGSTTYTVQSKY